MEALTFLWNFFLSEAAVKSPDRKSGQGLGQTASPPETWSWTNFEAVRQPITLEFEVCKRGMIAVHWKMMVRQRRE
jgi:hypothetical protein